MSDCFSHGKQSIGVRWRQTCSSYGPFCFRMGVQNGNQLIFEILRVSIIVLEVKSSLKSWNCLCVSMACIYACSVGQTYLSPLPLGTFYSVKGSVMKKNQSSHSLHGTKRVWGFILTKLVIAAGKWIGKEKVPHQLCSEICLETYIRHQANTVCLPSCSTCSEN